MICEGNQQITINHKLVTLLCYIILQITAEMLSNCTLTGPSVWCQDYIFIISRIACLHIFKIKNMVFDWMNCHSMYGTWNGDGTYCTSGENCFMPFLGLEWEVGETLSAAAAHQHKMCNCSC